MKRISPEEAAQLNYKSITTPINLTTESHIIHSIEKSMTGCDAVWIYSPEVINPPPKHNVCATVQCARKSHEIITSKS